MEEILVANEVVEIEDKTRSGFLFRVDTEKACDHGNLEFMLWVFRANGILQKMDKLDRKMFFFVQIHYID